MSTQSRRGTFLLVCIAITTTAVILGFAFMRTLEWQRDASQTNQHTQLARQAAQEGLSHALEQILVDQSMATIDMPTDAGTKTIRAVTFPDGPYRAPFTSHHLPNSTAEYGDDNDPSLDKDVRNEHLLIFPWLRFDSGHNILAGWYQGGQSQLYDGRGRYYEPGFYNVTRNSAPTDPAINPAQSGPVSPVDFVDLTPGGAPPERNHALFLDEDLKPIVGSDPWIDRQKARYRLRYAVGVEDLGGHLLMNPNARMRVPEDGRNPPMWVRRSANSFGAIMGEMEGEGPGVTHWEHLFLGRGWFSNTDREQAASINQGRPVTFPLMYRWADTTAGKAPPWSMAQRDGVSDRPLGLYASERVPANPLGGDLLWANNPDTHNRWYTGWDGSDPYVQVKDASQQGRYANAQLGPQLSWHGMFYAFKGLSHDARPQSYDERDQLSAHFTLTPYGRAQRRVDDSNFTPASKRLDMKWYQGRIDNPWHVNLLTAPPRVFSAMLNAYLGSTFKWTEFQTVEFRWTDPATGNPASGSLLCDPTNPINHRPAGRDLFVTTANADLVPLLPADVADPTVVPLFNHAAPTRAPATAGEIRPDYYLPTGINRFAPELVASYPGALWNGNPVQAAQGGDDLGRDINVSNPINETHTRPVLDPATGVPTGATEPKPTGASYFSRNPSNLWWSSYVAGYDSYTHNSMWNRGQGAQEGRRVEDFRYRHQPFEDLYNLSLLPGNTVTQAQYESCFDFSSLGLPAGTLPPADWWSRYPDPVTRAHDRAAHNNPCWRTSPINHDSYWWDLAIAFSHAAGIVRNQWVVYPANAAPAPSPWLNLFPPGQKDATNYATLRDLDRVFLAHLGESLDNPGTDFDPTTLPIFPFPHTGYDNRNQNDRHGVYWYTNPTQWLNRDFHPEYNIRKLALGNRLKPHDPLNPTLPRDPMISRKRAALMELVLNDFRMSFLGSSPEYSDPVAFPSRTLDPANEFRPLDFDGDGYAACSCYTDPNPLLRLDAGEPTSVDAVIPAAAVVSAGRGPKPDHGRYFSLTGNFHMGKSHYFRVWSRGELYDNRSNTPLQEAMLEAVVAADPEAKAYSREQDPTGPVRDTQVLYQRWMFDKYAGQLSRIRE